jgi:hypothetical protein
MTGHKAGVGPFQPTDGVSIIFEGWGSRSADEGIRHINIGEAGYLDYPDTLGMAAALVRVHGLINEVTEAES